jgi:hypothetical protein
MVLKHIRNLDIFGHALNLTFRGKATHQTLVGGLLTLF